MLFEPDEREIRKKKYISRIRKRKVDELIAPLREKLRKLDRKEIEPEEFFRLAGHVAREGSRLIGDFRKRTDVILAGIAMQENLCMSSVGDIGVSVRKGRVTEVFSDGIINPASPDGRMEHGAGALIKEEGGSGIESEAVSGINGENTVVTGAGDLHCKHIIHVNPRETEGSGYTPDSVKKALSIALDAAEELELNTIAIPDMGEPSGDITAQQLVKATLEAIRSHKGEEVNRIVLVSESDEIAGMFVEELEVHE